MRAVVQRVFSARVEVEDRVVSEIGPGLLVLVGVHESDTDADADYISGIDGFLQTTSSSLWLQEGLKYEAVSEFRHWERVGSELSQFTLYGILKGNKPDFHVAMPPHKAKPYYESLVEKFRKAYTSDAVKDGVFGAMMKVNLVNDGPVTMQLDSSQSRVGTSLEYGEQGDLPL